MWFQFSPSLPFNSPFNNHKTGAVSNPNLQVKCEEGSRFYYFHPWRVSLKIIQPQKCLQFISMAINRGNPGYSLLVFKGQNKQTNNYVKSSCWEVAGSILKRDFSIKECRSITGISAEGVRQEEAWQLDVERESQGCFGTAQGMAYVCLKRSKCLWQSRTRYLILCDPAC